MAGKNQVTLTFVGDSDKLEKTLDNVGGSTEKMSRKVEESGSSFDRAGESADTFDTRMMGMSNLMGGTTDTAQGFSRVMSGDLVGGLYQAGLGLSDLGSGFYNFLIPGLKSAVEWLGKTKVGILAQAAASKIASVATKVWTGVQAAFNAVMELNPVVLITTAIIALIAVIILAYKHSQTFRNIVNAAFHAVLAVVKSVWSWIKGHWPLLLAILTGPIGLAVVFIVRHWNMIKSAGVRVWNWIASLPGKVASVFARIASAIASPFIAGFNAIRNAWNSTVGGKGFTIPSWIPGLGGKGFHIPYFHTGGIVGGTGDQLAMLRAGEGVFTREQMAAMGGRNGTQRIVIEFAGGGDSELWTALKKQIRVRGGDPSVLGA